MAGIGYIDIDNAATYLGTTVRHIRRLVYEHQLPHYKLGGRLRFTTTDLDTYMMSKAVTPTTK